MATVKATKKYFNVFPSVCVIKTINPLSEAAKKTFGVDWDYYYSVRISLFKWSCKIEF